MFFILGLFVINTHCMQDERYSFRIPKSYADQNLKMPPKDPLFGENIPEINLNNQNKNIDEETRNLKDYSVGMSGIIRPLLQRNTSTRGSLADIIGGGRQRTLESGPIYPFEVTKEIHMSPWGTTLTGPLEPSSNIVEALSSPAPLNFWPAIDTFSKAFSGYSSSERPDEVLIGVSKLPKAGSDINKTQDQNSVLNVSNTSTNSSNAMVSSINDFELTKKQLKNKKMT